MARPCFRCTDEITGPGPQKLCTNCSAEWAWCPRCKGVLPLLRFTRRSNGLRTSYRGECYYRYHLQRKFGISDADVAVLAAVEVCGICGQPPAPDDRLHVDHDHTTGEIRGVLCRWCNYAVAVLEDERLAAVHAYLATPRLQLIRGGA